MTEMSMGTVEDNLVRRRHRRRDLLRGPLRLRDLAQQRLRDAARHGLRRPVAGSGYGVVAHYGAVAELHDNSFAQSRAAAAFADGRLVSR